MFLYLLMRRKSDTWGKRERGDGGKKTEIDTERDSERVCIRDVDDYY